MRKFKVVVLAIIVNIGCMTMVNAQEIGLQFYSLRNQFKEDVPKTLKMINSWGITAIEGGETYGVPIEEFKSMLKANNLNVYSVGGSYENLRDNIDGVIENAKAFGASYVMCPWIPHDGDNFTSTDAKKAVSLFNKAGKKLKDNGLTLVYHPHGYEFRAYENGTLFDYMAKNAKNYGFEMDVFWVKHGGADPLTLLNTYPKKFLLMHLKDMQKGVKGNNTGHENVETNVVLGTGQVDIAALVKRGKELGIKYMFLEDESSRVTSQVPQSLTYLKGL